MSELQIGDLVAYTEDTCECWEQHRWTDYDAWEEEQRALAAALEAALNEFDAGVGVY